MGDNPINLTLRFFLELAALYCLGYWGWTQHSGVVRYLLTIVLPLVAAVFWGVFRVPNDGGAPVVQVPGIVRLLIEAAVFGSATWCLFDAGATTAGWIFGGITLFHYIISYDRVLRVLQQ